MKIDAHQHFWSFHPIRYGWIDDSMEKLQQDFLPHDLEPLLQKHGFDGCVAVQAETSEDDTHFLLQLADRHAFIKGVVGWIDLTAPNLESRLGELSTHPRLKGIRHTIQSEGKGFMIQEKFLKGVAKLKEHGLCYDILIGENQLPECVQMLKHLPEMNLVIDHLGKPNIREGSFKNWVDQMKKISSFGHVRVKLSGLVTEADWQNWTKEDLEPYLQTSLEYFGADRLMFGSDWPVCLTAAEYDEVLDVVKDFISRLSPSEQEAIMGKTATDFYKPEFD